MRRRRRRREAGEERRGKRESPTCVYLVCLYELHDLGDLGLCGGRGREVGPARRDGSGLE